jgi:DNA-binding transcriptional ArsR family regulator
METEDAIEGLAALAHPGRLAVFRLLVQAGDGGMPAGDVARRLETPANTMSAQLAILARAGLVSARRDGRSIFYQADYARIGALLGFLMEDCCQGRAEVCAPPGQIAAAAGAACKPKKEQRQ